MTSHKIFSTVALTVATFAITLATGCGGENKSASAPTQTTTTAASKPPMVVNLSPASAGKTNSTIYLSDALRNACGITTVDTVNQAPKFDFDKDVILAADRDVLARVADCLTTGPLKGRSVKLVGRADPRGAQEYNMALGEHRANAVMRYLGGLGVASTQLSETSRGALDATGNDESAWRQDRRVDLDLL